MKVDTAADILRQHSGNRPTPAPPPGPPAAPKAPDLS